MGMMIRRSVPNGPKEASGFRTDDGRRPEDILVRSRWPTAQYGPKLNPLEVGASIPRTSCTAPDGRSTVMGKKLVETGRRKPLAWMTGAPVSVKG